MQNNIYEEWAAKSEYRYVLYARKSNTDENQQTHSIADQIKDCKNYAAAMGNIKIVNVIEESASARYPHNRPMFTQMLKDIERGKYDGIIAYHPDRIARNMLEAGMVMDMLKPAKNKKVAVLKDLLFPTTPFHNDSSGALTLAFHFAMATNYSDHLQEVVSRGIKSHLAEGKSSGAHKWGYHRDHQGYYRPNEKRTETTGDVFADIRAGFDMILDGKSQADVIRYFSELDVHYMTRPKEKTAPKKYSLTNSSSVSRLLRDPFYCGILTQANQEVDLTKLPEAGFVPMLTREEWEEVQRLLKNNYNNSHRAKTRKHKRYYYPFRGLIRCKCCGHTLTPFTSSGHRKNNPNWVYYGCQNKDCPKAKKNVRGKVIIEQLANFADSLSLTAEAYKVYSAAIEHYTEVELVELKKKRISLSGVKSAAERKRDTENEALKALMTTPNTPKSAISSTIAKVEEYQEQIAALEAEIKEMDEKLKDPNKIKLSQQQFLELIKTAAKQLKYGHYIEKDTVVRKLFSNLVLDEKNQLSISIKPEFEGLIVPKIAQMVE